MKKLIISIFIILLCSFQASAWNPMMMSSGNIGESCTTANDSVQYQPTATGTSEGNADIWGNKVTFATDVTVTGYYNVDICDNNSDTGSIRIVMVDDTSSCGGPGSCPDESSEVSGTGKTVAMSVVADDCPTESENDFDLDTPQLVSAGTYWVIAKELSSADIGVHFSTSSSGDTKCYSNDAGSNYTCASDAAYGVEIWGCN